MSRAPQIDNLNPLTHQLIGDLMGGGVSDRQRPFPLELRPAWLVSNVKSTYVVPGDWPGDPAEWFAAEASAPPRRDANNVEYLIDGEATYEAIVEAMVTATGPEHFIIIIGWTLHVDFLLSKYGKRCRQARSTLLSVLTNRIDAGVRVRVLLFPNLLDDGWVNAKNELDSLTEQTVHSTGLPGARCVVDRSLRPLGAHHQKVVLVSGADGLVGFLGGIDFNPDRVHNIPLWGVYDVHGPLNDVHVRVKGAAANDLLRLAVDRWNYAEPDRPEIVPEEPGGGGAEGRQPGMARRSFSTGRDLEDLTWTLGRVEPPSPPPIPHYVVRVGETVGNPRLVGVHSNTVWHTVSTALSRATQFIYMEDQYLWSCPAARLLGKAASRVRHVTILLAWDDLIGMRERFDALRAMKEAAGASAKKIRIYVIAEETWRYVHSKIFVIDDQLAIIGSANCNDRGYAYDSEVNSAIADHAWTSRTGTREGQWWIAEMNLARRLRIQRWQRHLRRAAEDLVDGVAAEVHWRRRREDARVTDYLVRENLLTMGQLWHEADYENVDLVVGSPIAPIWPATLIRPAISPTDLLVDPPGAEEY